jgi:hypothetical protein
MLERSTSAGDAPFVVIRVGFDATVEGWDSDRVLATTDDRWGLKLERKKGSVEVSAGVSCTVKVPFGSTVKVYAGRTAHVSAIRGSVAVVAGGSTVLTDIHRLTHLSAGFDTSIDCEEIEGNHVKFAAGRDLRFLWRNLTNTSIYVKDSGGPWRVAFGDGAKHIELKAGGIVTLVTDQTPSSTSDVVGRIERT